MPSPFPGMDPYLEDPALWPDVHHEFMSEARALLTRDLPSNYFVGIELRIYVSDDEDPGRRVLVPDLRIGTSGEEQVAAHVSGHGIALATVEPVTITKLLDEEIHEAFLEIHDLDLDRIVTILEVTSPANKVAGSMGRASLIGKRRQILQSPCHWVEIDLLRTGAPLISRELQANADYCVHVSRAGNRPNSQAWPIRLEQRLPVIPIPIKAEDPDVALDLQQVLDNVYDRARYDRKVKYRQAPTVPLTPAQAAWTDALLKNRGLR